MFGLKVPIEKSLGNQWELRKTIETSLDCSPCPVNLNNVYFWWNSTSFGHEIWNGGSSILVDDFQIAFKIRIFIMLDLFGLSFQNILFWRGFLSCLGELLSCIGYLSYLEVILDCQVWLWRCDAIFEYLLESTISQGERLKIWTYD